MNKKMLISVDCEKLTKLLTHEVYARLRQFGKSFWIAYFGPWVHPYNKVKNCFALTFDGFIHYKFEMIYNEKRKNIMFRVAKIPIQNDDFDLGIKLNKLFTLDEIIWKIKTAKVG